jgi:peptidoglycan hydrolase-like protein with peptidoglycan-binding domain
MRTIVLALAAAAALTIPAVAQQTDSKQNQSAAQDPGKADQGKDGGGSAIKLNRTQTRMLQHQLNRAGLDVGRADGIFGTRTKEALQKWQTQKGLTASGEVDQNTLAALRQLRREGNTASAKKQGKGGEQQSQPQQGGSE